jgi:hypothetical protein
MYMGCCARHAVFVCSQYKPVLLMVTRVIIRAINRMDGNQVFKNPDILKKME